MKFLGFPRPDGSFGTRNYVLVIPGGMVADQICSFVAGTRTLITADTGSGRTSRDRETIARVLTGLGRNPNVAAVIVHDTGPGEGYPELGSERLAQEIALSKKPVEVISAAREGGLLPLIQKGIELARRFVWEASRIQRELCNESHLTLGVKCGASDPTSGLAGNPTVGYAYDKLVSAGGTAMFGENTEIIGAEHILARRAASHEIAQGILRVAGETEERAKAMGEDIRTINPVPANIAAGISTLEEKSLGAIYKAGSSAIQGVLQYGQRPPGKGLYFVDNWMSHLSIFLGYAAAGANLVLYQLGGGGMKGNTLLHPSTAVVAPLFWTSANPKTRAMAGDSLDFYSGTIIEGSESVEQAGERMYQALLEVASGAMTKVETLNYQMPVQIYTRDPVF